MQPEGVDDISLVLVLGNLSYIHAGETPALLVGVRWPRICRTPNRKASCALACQAVSIAASPIGGRDEAHFRSTVLAA